MCHLKTVSTAKIIQSQWQINERAGSNGGMILTGESVEQWRHDTDRGECGAMAA